MTSLAHRASGALLCSQRNHHRDKDSKTFWPLALYQKALLAIN